jgi:hypothetical protein
MLGVHDACTLRIACQELDGIFVFKEGNGFTQIAADNNADLRQSA